MPKMLTLRAAAEETGLAYNFLRNLCLQKKVKYCKAGVKFLLNMDSLAEYLNEGDCDE